MRARWKEKRSANKTVSSHFSPASPDHKFCHADAAPTRGWGRGAIHSETNEGFDHGKQIFIACQGEKHILVSKQKIILIGKLKGDKFTPGLRVIHTRSFAPPA